MHHSRCCAIAVATVPPLFLFSLSWVSILDSTFVLLARGSADTKICLKSNGISTRRSNNRSITIIQPFYKFLQLIFRRIIIFTFLFDSERECVRACVIFIIEDFCTRSLLLRLASRNYASNRSELYKCSVKGLIDSNRFASPFEILMCLHSLRVSTLNEREWRTKSETIHFWNRYRPKIEQTYPLVMPFFLFVHSII